MKNKNCKIVFSQQSGFSLVDLITGMAISSVVMFIAYSYVFVHTKNIKSAQSYISQEQTGHLVERFFRKEDQCAKTLSRAERVPGMAFTVEEIISVNRKSGDDNPPQPAKEFFQGLKRGIRAAPLRLQGDKGLVLISYTVSELDAGTGRLREREKSFYIDVLRNNSGRIEKCLAESAEHTNYCKGGYEHVLAYDETSLNPIMSSLIEEAQPSGKIYKTFTKKDENVSCLSYSACDQGEWQNDIFCHNSCTDEAWSKGDERYRKLAEAEAEDEGCTGAEGTSGILVECPSKSLAWCPATLLNIPRRCCVSKAQVQGFCDDQRKPDGSYSEPKAKEKDELCENPQAVCTSSSAFKLPEGQYGDVETFPRKNSSKGGFFSVYQSLYAQCDYTGEWHILGVTCDEDLNIDSSRPQNIYGRIEDFSGVCVPEYPPSQCACRTSETLRLEPHRTLDDNGKPITPKNLTVKEVFGGNIENEAACGVPVRFAYDFKGKDSLMFTYVCDPKTKRFKLASRATHCQAKDRKPKLDMVFIIDNSGSMIEEQENLADNLDRFFKSFLSEKLNFNIAVITTDFKLKELVCNHPGCLKFRLNGRSYGIEEHDISKVQGRLKKAVKAGKEGSGIELPFISLMVFNNSGSGFFRKGAATSFFVLTDEDPDGLRGNCISAEKLIKILFGTESFKVKSCDIRGYRMFGDFEARPFNLNKKKTAIFIGVNDDDSEIKYRSEDCDSGSQGYPGKIRYFMSLLDDVKPSEAYKSPHEVDLCDPSFGDKLEAFGKELASLIQTSNPPQRPYVLDILDQKNLNESLKNLTKNRENNIQCK